MKTKQLNKWLALLANLGVIAGIAFLALEIRQSNRDAIATNDIALRESFATLNESVYGNPQLAELMFKARDPAAEFSGAELEMIGSYVARHFNTWGAYERAHKAGLTSPDAMEGTIDDVRSTIELYPGFRWAFREHVEFYPAYGDSVIYQAVRELLENE